jgi:putative transposase
MSAICYKFRLYPTPAQETCLLHSLETCRQVYISLLHWRTFAYETEHISVGYKEQAVALAAWKQEHPELRRVYSQVLQNVARRVSLAFDPSFDVSKQARSRAIPEGRARATTA